MMTGIYNRRGFYHFFAENIEKRINTKCSLIIHSIDMDGLKTINDTYGHKEGDYAISVLAQGLIKSGNETVIAARFGGDEFVTVEFTENGQEPDINSFRKNLQEYLNTVNVHSGKPYKISCSVGSHSTLFPPNMNVDQIIAEADKLMYDEKSKKSARNPDCNFSC